MEDLLYKTSLFDYYKNLLTETQVRYFKEYYFDNLSIQEIADNNNISKSAVSKTLIETTTKLEYFEKELSLYKNYNKIKSLINEETLNKINDYI